MHVLLTILGGVLLLGVFLLFGHLWGANAPSVALAAKAFSPAWLVVAIANLLVGRAPRRLHGARGAADPGHRLRRTGAASGPGDLAFLESLTARPRRCSAGTRS